LRGWEGGEGTIETNTKYKNNEKLQVLNLKYFAGLRYF
jgi:hypothetical protein